MYPTREQIAAAIRGLGLNNAAMSEITSDRASKGQGVPVSPDVISSYLKAGYDAGDIKMSQYLSLAEALIAEGARFEAPDWVQVPEGSLAKRRGKK